MSSYTFKPKYKKYRILYRLANSEFSSSITVTALNIEQAIEDAKNEVAKAYGSAMLDSFTFKPDPLYTGVII